MPIHSPISPGMRSSDSPPLELSPYTPEQSPDKKARPSPLTPGLLKDTKFICINTPTITVNTPRNPVTPVRNFKF